MLTKQQKKEIKRQFKENFTKEFFDRAIILFNHKYLWGTDKRVIIYRNGYNSMFHFASFTSVKQFKDFFKLFNIHFDFDFISGCKEGYKIGRLSKNLVSYLHFWKLSDIPAGCKKTKALSNGSIVDCYIEETDKEIILHRPNPNSKEVYKPLDIRNHIRFQERFGVY